MRGHHVHMALGGLANLWALHPPTHRVCFTVQLVFRFSALLERRQIFFPPEFWKSLFYLLWFCYVGVTSSIYYFVKLHFCLLSNDAFRQRGLVDRYIYWHVFFEFNEWQPFLSFSRSARFSKNTVSINLVFKWKKKLSSIICRPCLLDTNLC